METEKYFVGMLKNAPNIFLVGQIVSEGEEVLDYFMAKNLVRVMEAHDQNRVLYQFMPDPYFTVESASFLQYDDFLTYRIETNKDEKVLKDYENFLMQLRANRSGIVAPHPPKAQAPIFTTR